MLSGVEAAGRSSRAAATETNRRYAEDDSSITSQLKRARLGFRQAVHSELEGVLFSYNCEMCVLKCSQTVSSKCMFQNAADLKKTSFAYFVKAINFSTLNPSWPFNAAVRLN